MEAGILGFEPTLSLSPAFNSSLCGELLAFPPTEGVFAKAPLLELEAETQQRCLDSCLLLYFHCLGSFLIFIFYFPPHQLHNNSPINAN